MIAVNAQGTTLSWLFYDGHGNVVRRMFPHPLPLSRSFGRGVSRRRRGEGYCANLGHPEDETGLVYMRARYYEPLTGRFLSEDPSQDGVNWYLYADGNPVSNIDFTGRRVNRELFDRIFFGVPTALGCAFAMTAVAAAIIGRIDTPNMAQWNAVAYAAGYAAIVLLVLASLGIGEYYPAQTKYVNAAHAAARALIGFVAALAQAVADSDTRLANGFAMTASLATFAYSVALVAMIASIGIDTPGGE